MCKIVQKLEQKINMDVITTSMERRLGSKLA